MSLSIYQVDAFGKDLFTGNPAAVIPLDEWLDDKLLQQLAMENNLSETAFFVPAGDGFELRWFTPNTEVELCGHATLATAHVLWEELGRESDTIKFFSKHKGELLVRRRAEGLMQLNFPAEKAKPIPLEKSLTEALGLKPQSVYMGETDIMATYKNQEDVINLIPNFNALSDIEVRGIIVTSIGDVADIVCRFFAPAVGINEDPVTGSAHCLLAPYWSERLGQQILYSKQMSARGGDLICEMAGDRVLISGKASTYMSGSIRL